MDDHHPANPVWRVAVYTLAQLSTRDIDIESPGIDGCSHILNPLDRFLNILYKLVITGNKNYLSRTENGPSDPVSTSIDINQFSVQSDSIDAAEIKVGVNLRLADLKALLF
jgi:hypothetical protein